MGSLFADLRDANSLDGRPIAVEVVSDGIILDYDKDGNLVGIEVLDASKKAGDLETLHQLSLDVPHIAD